MVKYPYLVMVEAKHSSAKSRISFEAAFQKEQRPNQSTNYYTILTGTFLLLFSH